MKDNLNTLTNIIVTLKEHNKVLTNNNKKEQTKSKYKEQTSYIFIENIKEKEWEDFMHKSNKSHFMQSYYWGEVKKNKKIIPHYVGIKKENDLIGTALILEKRILKNIKYFYCPRGFTIDYTNLELVQTFIDYLKKYTKKERAIFLRLDPDIYYQILNNDGSPKSKPQNGTDILNLFINNKLKHKGFNKNFENNEPRYTFRLSLNRPWDEIFASFHSTTRKILKKQNQYNLEIRKGNIKDIKDFYTTMIETAKRKHIIPFKLEYYKKFYQILNEHNMSDLYIAKVNKEKLYKTLKDKIITTNLQIKEINKQNQNTIDLEKQKNKLLKQIQELKNIKEEEIILSSIITVKYQDKVWMVHGGHNNILRDLNANYLICEKIIKDAYSEGYKIIDFFGTTGYLSKNNPIYGIHLFKERLGGDYIEFIGEFDYIRNKSLYYIYTKLIPIYRKIIRKTKQKNIQN